MKFKNFRKLFYGTLQNLQLIRRYSAISLNNNDNNNDDDDDDNNNNNNNNNNKNNNNNALF